MNDQFNVGDEVQLKSGGPVMTVDSIDEYTLRVVCVWFDSKHVLQNAKFAAGTLKKYDSTGEGDIYFA